MYLHTCCITPRVLLGLMLQLSQFLTQYLLAHKVFMFLKTTVPRHSNRHYWYQSTTEQSQNLKLRHQEHLMSENVKGFIALKLLP